MLTVSLVPFLQWHRLRYFTLLTNFGRFNKYAFLTNCCFHILSSFNISRAQLGLAPKASSERNRLLYGERLGCLADCLEQQGLGGMYRGLTPSLFALFVSNFFFYYTFHGLKRIADILRRKASCTLVTCIRLRAHTRMHMNSHTHPVWRT